MKKGLPFRTKSWIRGWILRHQRAISPCSKESMIRSLASQSLLLQGLWCFSFSSLVWHFSTQRAMMASRRRKRAPASKILRTLHASREEVQADCPMITGRLNERTHQGIASSKTRIKMRIFPRSNIRTACRLSQRKEFRQFRSSQAIRAMPMSHGHRLLCLLPAAHTARITRCRHKTRHASRRSVLQQIVSRSN